MTAPDESALDDAADFVLSVLGEPPDVTLVVERGVLSPELLMTSVSSTWQATTPSGGPAPFRLQCGRVDGVPILMIVEVPPYRPVRIRTFPIAVASRCESNTVFVAAHAAPLDPTLNAGELLVVTDHINLLGDSPLIGGSWGSQESRFCDMNHVYGASLRNAAKRAAGARSVRLHEGVYVASPLAQRPDSSAIESLRVTGGQACGTGIVPHALAARQASLQILAICTLVPTATHELSGESGSIDSNVPDTPASRLSCVLESLIGDLPQRTSPRLRGSLSSNSMPVQSSK
jgi:hypothetical protein